jgi:hypothetical protein
MRQHADAVGSPKGKERCKLARMEDAEMLAIAYEIHSLLMDPLHRGASVEKLRPTSEALRLAVHDVAEEKVGEAEREYAGTAATLHSLLVIFEKRPALAENEHVRNAAEFMERRLTAASKRLLDSQYAAVAAAVALRSGGKGSETE